LEFGSPSDSCPVITFSINYRTKENAVLYACFVGAVGQGIGLDGIEGAITDVKKMYFLYMLHTRESISS